MIENGPVQTVAIKLEAHSSLEYHYMLKHLFVLVEIAKIFKPFIRRGWPITFGNIVYPDPQLNKNLYLCLKTTRKFIRLLYRAI